MVPQPSSVDDKEKRMEFVGETLDLMQQQSGIHLTEDALCTTSNVPTVFYTLNVHVYAPALDRTFTCLSHGVIL